MENINEEEVFTFRLNEVETKRAKTFCALHMMHVAHMPAGEAFCFKFIPTHIGIVAILQCMTCNEHIDLTDYEQLAELQNIKTMTIYKDNAPTSREIWLEVEDGMVRMVQQDLGPACQIMTDEDEYEREVSCKLKDLETALRLKGAAAVLDQLSKMFHSSDSIDRFMVYLSQNGIRYDLYSD